MVNDAEKAIRGRGGDGRGRELQTFTEGQSFSLEIGGKTVDQLKAELDTGGYTISTGAYGILHNPGFLTLKKPTIILLDVITLDSLGYHKLKGYDQVFEAFQAQGYPPVPAEVGAHLRMVNLDLPMGERIAIGMRPLIDSDGYGRILGLRNSDAFKWLEEDSQGGGKWKPQDKVVVGHRSQVGLS